MFCEACQKPLQDDNGTIKKHIRYADCHKENLVRKQNQAKSPFTDKSLPVQLNMDIALVMGFFNLPPRAVGAIHIFLRKYMNNKNGVCVDMLHSKTHETWP